MRIFLNDKLLAVEKRKDHRDGNSCGIIEEMEKRSREKNPFFHVFGALLLFKNKNCVAFLEELLSCLLGRLQASGFYSYSIVSLMRSFKL